MPRTFPICLWLIIATLASAGDGDQLQSRWQPIDDAVKAAIERNELPGGVVLIDEVENGLHYSGVKDVWKAIAVAARQMDVQVFATTHSYECIQAAHDAFTASGIYDLRLFRLDRLNGEIQVAAYDQDVLGYATEMRHEVR